MGQAPLPAPSDGDDLPLRFAKGEESTLHELYDRYSGAVSHLALLGEQPRHPRSLAEDV